MNKEIKLLLALFLFLNHINGLKYDSLNYVTFICLDPENKNVTVKEYRKMLLKVMSTKKNIYIHPVW